VIDNNPRLQSTGQRSKIGLSSGEVGASATDWSGRATAPRVTRRAIGVGKRRRNEFSKITDVKMQNGIRTTLSKAPIIALVGSLVWMPAQAADSSTHTAEFITVDSNISLEVFDWGGTARPLVLLSGNGETAHVLDSFGPKLTAKCHGYGINRRGFRTSRAPASEYSADRLGDDVLTEVDALRLDRPVIARHSLAGEELSSIGSRHPEKAAGLIYLDAGYSYASDDASRGELIIGLLDKQEKLGQLLPGNGIRYPSAFLKDLLETSPGLEKDLPEFQKQALEAGPVVGQMAPIPPVLQQLAAGMPKYTSIPVPVFAISAVPTGAFGTETSDAASVAPAKAFEVGVSTARVIRLAHANHFGDRP
jgi:non-heme chloroperoxidase